MNGLQPIQVVDFERGFIVLGLDNRGRVWYGEPKSQDGTDWSLEWKLMKDEVTG